MKKFTLKDCLEVARIICKQEPGLFMAPLNVNYFLPTLDKRLPFCEVKIVFKVSDSLKNYFGFKDIIPESLRSYQIYDFTCASCNASYTGKTFRLRF